MGGEEAVDTVEVVGEAIVDGVGEAASEVGSVIGDIFGSDDEWSIFGRKSVKQNGDGRKHEVTDGFKIASTEMEKDQVAASAEDSDMDQMISVSIDMKNGKQKRLEEEAD